MKLVDKLPLKIRARVRREIYRRRMCCRPEMMWARRVLGIPELTVLTNNTDGDLVVRYVDGRETIVVPHREREAV